MKDYENFVPENYREEEVVVNQFFGPIFGL